MKLDLFSERYPPTGMISGEGFSRVLGTPPIGPLSVLVRESVQNTWDARAEGQVPKFRLHLRTLDTSQSAALRGLMADIPDAYGESTELCRVLRQDTPIRVLEVSDFGTSGLGGPARADDSGAVDEPTDFNDFIRNIGSARDKALGGGTYGYGKSSLYRASKCATILVHTRATCNGQPVERLMGSHLASQYRVAGGENAGHYTGRHWWGTLADDGVIDPVEGCDATSSAALIGVDRRGPSDAGTTVLILDPDLPTDMDQGDVVGLLEQALLFNFWPKMLAVGDQPPAMQFELMLDGEIQEIRSPLNVPPLGAFASAFLAIKGHGEADVKKTIWSGRPKKKLGTLALDQTPRRDRGGKALDDLAQTIWERSHHVALMRPAELVVRYLPGPPHQLDDLEYGGVFICEESLESVFAKSEPPAHDDWIPDSLPRPGSTYIRVALRKIRESMESLVTPESARGDTSGDAVKVSAMSLDLGQLIVSNDQSKGAGRRRKKPSGGGGPPRPRSNWKVKRPEPLRLEMVEGVPAMIFGSKVTCDDGVAPILSGLPRVVMEGGEAEESVTGERPTLLRWSFEDGSISNEERCTVPEGFKGELEVAVSIPTGCAVSLKLSGALEGADQEEEM